MATTGSSLAADLAGSNPAINPIILEIISPVIMFPTVKTIVNSLT
jgi:hypothetical protein